jgi:hypothetical protein
LQVLAPLIALAPLAGAPFDPLIHAALCSDLARRDGGDRSSHSDKVVCCVLCAPLAGGVATLVPPAGAIGAPPLPLVSHVIWLAPDRHLPGALLNPAAAPRAPPASV